MTLFGLGIILLIVSFIKWMAGWLLFIGFFLVLISIGFAAELVRKIKRKFSAKKLSGIPIEQSDVEFIIDEEHGEDLDAPRYAEGEEEVERWEGCSFPESAIKKSS